jgi:hypothetical protein
MIASPIQKNILLIVHDPRIPEEGGKELHRVFDWNDPDALTRQYINDVAECSNGVAQYEIVERIEVDAFPKKVDGFHYTPESYVRAWRSRTGFHHPDTVDYYELINQFDLIHRIDEGVIDEIWLFGFPYAGYYESIMGGPGAFWCNSPPLTETDYCHRRFVIMGFNYERGVGEMLENLGHRAESIMRQVFQGREEEDNLWERFTRYDMVHPGRSEVGNVHFAPNSERDYDWGNRRMVQSNCDDWYNYPDFTFESRSVNCAEWGNGDIRLHHMWWFKHFPHLDGEIGGISHNWWDYVLDLGAVST